MVSYFAAAVARDSRRWSASEISLQDAADVEDVADRLRDLFPSADVALLFVEFDDSYLVVLRLDEGEDLRVFGSDAAFAAESRVGALLLRDLAPPLVAAAAVGTGHTGPGTRRPGPDLEPDLDLELGVDLSLEVETPEAPAAPDEDDEDAAGPPTRPLWIADPTGDADLLADLGVPARKLLDLCAQEGMLPSDITAELCQSIGCGDEVEELREA